MSLRKVFGLAILAVFCLLGATAGSAHAQCNHFSGAYCATDWSGGSVIDLGVPNSTRNFAEGSTTRAGRGKQRCRRTSFATEWSGSSVINLGGPPGTTLSEAIGINDAGQVVGSSVVGGSWLRH